MPDNEKAKSFISNWIIEYLRNKDITLKKIISIDQTSLKIKYADKEQQIFAIPFIEDFNFLESLDKQNHYLIAVFNTKSNLNKTIDNWHKLVEFKFLCIYFINPWSSLDKRWIIFPYTHHRIADESTLRTGLKSMFETVEPVTDNMLSKI